MRASTVIQLMLYMCCVGITVALPRDTQQSIIAPGMTIAAMNT